MWKIEDVNGAGGMPSLATSVNDPVDMIALIDPAITVVVVTMTAATEESAARTATTANINLAFVKRLVVARPLLDHVSLDANVAKRLGVGKTLTVAEVVMTEAAEATEGIARSRPSKPLQASTPRVSVQRRDAN
ncbi:MAG: hypothetical protein HYW77_03505 [Parcubacteria group bacterium]|nr:hypothetical protein [Parcubacteria group bacterium]